MSHFPDCRSDPNYNSKFLNEKDAGFLKGYDWCAEVVVDSFFNNLLDMFPEDTYLGHMLAEKVPDSLQEEYKWLAQDGTSEERKVQTYADLLQSRMIDWIEMERNPLITSMIDSMDTQEYEAIREIRQP